MAADGTPAWTPNQNLVSAKPSNYTYSGNGNGGLNYYLNGQGITNTQYGAGTGSDYGALERQAAADYLTSAQQNQYNQQNAANNAATASANANAASQYDRQAGQFQNQINGLDGQQATGLSNIGNQFNQSLNSLNDQNAKAQRDYNTSVANNNTNYQSTRNGIQTSTRSNANALQRLLGLNGAGNSSAAIEQAPYAAALQGSQNLDNANTTFAQNQAGLDTKWGDTKDNYQKTLDNLNQQLYQNQNATKSSIAQQRASLLNSLQQSKVNAGIARGQSASAAQASNDYSGQINDLLAQITGYGNNYASPIALKNNISYTAPTAQDYTLGKQAVATNGLGGAAGNINPTFLNLLTANKRDQLGNPLAA